MTVHFVTTPGRPWDQAIITIHIGDCKIEDSTKLCYFISERLGCGSLFYSDWVWDAGQGIIRVEANKGVPPETLEEAIKDIIDNFANIRKKQLINN